MSSSRLQNQFRLIEIASWILSFVILFLVMGQFISVDRPSFACGVLGLFLIFSFLIHHVLIRFISIQQCFLVESFIFVFAVTFLIRLTGDSQSPFWILYYMPITVALSILETRYCVWILVLTSFISMFEMARVFLHGDVERLPIVIMNVFSIGTLTVLQFILTQMVNQERAMKDRVMKDLEKALKTVREKTEQVEKFSEQLSETNQELMLQQTQLLALTESLENVNRELKKMDQIKSDFVSMVSHELKTPLTAIRESVFLLQEDMKESMPLEQKKFLFIIKHNAERLRQLISDVLDFSKLESGKMSMKKEKIDIGAVVQLMEEFWKGPVSEKKIQFKVRISETPLFVYADPNRIRQVFDNLTSNAIKFTPANGTIEVIAELKSRDEVLNALKEWNADRDLFNARQMERLALRNKFVLFGVKDSGSGISKEDLNKVFERFLQLDAHESRPRGTGLGLAIVKQLVLAHYGGLWVESQLGQGSFFRVCLPVYEEVCQIKNELERLIRLAEHSQLPGIWIVLDFIDPPGTVLDWRERMADMDRIENLIRSSLTLKDQTLYRLGGGRFLIVWLNSDRSVSLKLLEEIRNSIHASQYKMWEQGLRFSLQSFSWPETNTENLLRELDLISSEAGYDG